MENFSSSSFLFQSSYFALDKSDKVPVVLNEAYRSFYGYNTICWVALLSMPFLLTYLLTHVSAIAAINSKRVGKPVPTSPYWIPFLGHALDILFATSNALTIARRAFPQGPLAVKLGTQKLIFITGSENIIKVWQSRVLQSRETTLFSLALFFGLPKRSMGIFKTDTSGICHEPHPSSNTPHKDRVFYHTRKSITDFLKGPGFEHVAQKFQELLHIRILKHNIGQEWQEMPDLYDLMQDLFTGPLTESFFGPELLERSPDLISRLWRLDMDTFWFIKYIPNFLIPSASDNRTKLIASMKEWHSHANANANANCQEFNIEADGYDPYYGSSLIRQRQEFLTQVDTFNADTVASIDLGLLWAINGNAVPAVFWMLVEITRRPEALKMCLEEINNIIPREKTTAGNIIDANLVCKSPLLQSVYAEALRLYTSIFIVRSSVQEDFYLDNWRIPQDQVMVIDSRAAHLDSSIWNSQAVPECVRNISVYDFCPQRFLRYADEDHTNNQGTNTSSRKPYFSTKGLSGAWIPFGGGSRQCPGKKFAKAEIILGFVKFLSTFEIELLDEKEHGPILPDQRYYGIGIIQPQRKVAFKIRRRA